MIFLEKLRVIENQLNEYYQMFFENEREDYNYNKLLKNRLKELVISQKGNEKNINSILLVLAKNTGCVEDEKIAEEIIDYLYENKYINSENMSIFYDNKSTNRW